MFLDVDGRKLHVVSFGAGPRTLLAHGGWTGSWELWQQPFELLSANWRTVAYDHRGTGESKCAAQDITAAGLIADLFAVLDGLGIEQCVVASESAGSMTVIPAVVRQPERFSALILVAAPYQYPPTPGTSGFYQALLHDYPATVRGFVDACTPEPDVDHLRAWGRDIIMRAGQEQAARLFEIQLGGDISELLPQIRIPALIIHGDNDMIIPAASARRIAELIPNSRLAIMEGTGHVPTVTRPVVLARLIEDFLADVL